MPSSILSSLFSKAAFVIRDGTTGATVVPALKIRRVSIKYTARLMKHMREDGTTIADARIIQPIQVVAEVYCPDINTLSQLQAVMLNRDTMYTITSKSLVFINMKVDVDYMEQIPEALSAAPVRILFKQQLVENQLPIVFAQSADSSIISRGLTAIKSAAASVTDVASKISSFM